MMGGLFSTPKSPKLPVVKEEPVLPTAVADTEGRKRRRARGRAYTILTGDLAPPTGNKKILFGGA